MKWFYLVKVKSRKRSDTFSKQLVRDPVEIRDSKSVSENFNKYFGNIGPQLAQKVPSFDIRFESFLPVSNATLNETVLTEKGFEESFKAKI